LLLAVALVALAVPMLVVRVLLAAAGDVRLLLRSLVGFRLLMLLVRGKMVETAVST
jgi:hypothetical protein